MRRARAGTSSSWVKGTRRPSIIGRSGDAKMRSRCWYVVVSSIGRCERSPAVSGVPHDRGKRAERGEQGRRSRSDEAMRAASRSPTGLAGSTIGTSCVLCQMASPSNQPEGGDTHLRRSLDHPQRDQQQESGVQRPAGIEAPLMRELVDDERRPDPRHAARDDGGRLSDRPSADPPDHEQPSRPRARWERAEASASSLPATQNSGTVASTSCEPPYA